MSKLDEQDEMDEFEGEDEQDAEDEDDTETESAPAEAGPAVNHEESPEERTVASRQAQREEMEREIQEFLSRGGKIAQIEPNVTADPPRKPNSEYGSRPI